MFPTGFKYSTCTGVALSRVVVVVVVVHVVVVQYYLVCVGGGDLMSSVLNRDLWELSDYHLVRL